MTSNDTNGIQKDMVAEAVRVAEKAEDLALRLLGRVAIKVRATEGLQPAFERDYADLDWITPKRIKDRIETLLGRIEEEPRGFGWKMRAKFGDRKRWYELPEEVDGGP